jgi:hypothetical protein
VAFFILNGGAEGIRTHDPHNAIVVLYQLSYDPVQIRRQSKLPAQLVKTFRAGARIVIERARPN